LHTNHSSGKTTASANAGVTCVIVGLRKIQKSPKRLFTDELGRIVKNISPYLIDGDNGIVVKKSKPLSDIPPINFGSMPNDDGNLILSPEEKNALISAHSSAQKFVKSFIGSQEFIKGIQRFCLWIDSKDLKEAKKIPEIQKRIEKNEKYRLESTRAETRALAAQPYAFGEIRYKNAKCNYCSARFLRVTPYLTIGIVNKDTVISDAALLFMAHQPIYLQFCHQDFT
jgi:hypothetical protein